MFTFEFPGFNRRDGTNRIQINFDGSRRDLFRALRENRDNMIVEEHARLQEERAGQQRNRRRRTGVVRLSNVDSISRAHQIRQRLLAKLSEVAGSEMEPRARDAVMADIKMQLDRVEQQIAAIRRREQAILEERSARRETDTPEERRRRWRDMQERRIFIRRDFLYHSNDGGFDPNNMFSGFVFSSSANSPVVLCLGGSTSGHDAVGLPPLMEVVV